MAVYIVYICVCVYTYQYHQQHQHTAVAFKKLLCEFIKVLPGISTAQVN